jgi:dihydrolipoamide dehydrogenase
LVLSDSAFSYRIDGIGADAVDIGKTIHPHPTLGESIGMAAEVAHGSCTDLPPGKR